jgi:hypothetical protein
VLTTNGWVRFATGDLIRAIEALHFRFFSDTCNHVMQRKKLSFTAEHTVSTSANWNTLCPRLLSHRLFTESPQARVNWTFDLPGHDDLAEWLKKATRPGVTKEDLEQCPFGYSLVERQDDLVKDRRPQFIKCPPIAKISRGKDIYQSTIGELVCMFVAVNKEKEASPLVCVVLEYDQYTEGTSLGSVQVWQNLAGPNEESLTLHAFMVEPKTEFSEANYKIALVDVLSNPQRLHLTSLRF